MAENTDNDPAHVEGSNEVVASPPSVGAMHECFDMKSL